MSGTLASGGTVTLAASASDAGGGAVTRVEFYAGDRLVATSFAPVGGLYLGSWKVDAEPVGAYVLHAVAFDASGNAGRSADVPVTVADLEAPSVRIDRPDAGSFVGGVVRVEAAAADNRAVMRVELRADGEVVGTATAPPWAVDWDTGTRSGPVTLEAQAWDAHLTAVSAPVTVTLDNAPPSVAVVAPTAGSAVAGSVEVRVEASDDDHVARVELYAGGAYVDAATWNGTFWVVSWNSGTLPNGVVALQARAYDRAGNVASSAGVPVEVKDLTAPVVAITEPAAGALLRGTVQVSATATDDGVVTGVDFLADGTRIDFDAEAPYGVPWSTALRPDGEVTVKARVSDLGGNVGEASVTVTVDNHGPAVAIASPPAGTVHGVVAVKAVATDPYGVDFVDIWADGMLLGRGTAVTGEPDTYAVEWVTADFDNRTFALVAEAHDLAGNVTRSAPVAAAVSNVTTAEYDAALGAPACASPAAWCFSGTLLEAAGPAEAHAPNTLGGACLDGAGSQHYVSESIEGITVSAESGPLAPGAKVAIHVRYWAYAANEADQIDVYHAADARDPAWTWLGTATPPQVGAGEAVVKTVLPTGPLQAVRANFRFAQPGPSPCSGGDFGDRDDLVFAVGSPADAVPPTVSLDAPADGGVVSGDVYILASAQDDQGVAKVEFRVDGSLIETDTRPPYAAVWPAGLAADGPHTIEVRAFDTSGNEAAASPVTMTVLNASNAAFDPALGAPACGAVASFCDTGTLLDGRGSVGPEANAPNTLGASCLDGAAGAYHLDESLDWLKVSSVDGLPLAAGKRARVEARVWAWTGWSDDALDLYHTTSPDDPHWIWFATVKPAGPGPQTLLAEYQLPPGGLHAVRGRYRYGGTAGPCGAGLYDDHDDVVFAVDYTPNAAYDHQLGVPACDAEAAWCDSGALLDGRGPLGPEPHQPNTIGGLCADGSYGAYHVEPSVDRVLVRTDDLTPLRAGGTARLEVRVFASASWASERLDLFTTADPNAAAPAWSYLATLRPSRSGSQVLVGSVPLGAAGPFGIRARFFREQWPYLPVACGLGSGSNAVDDHDDLVFTAAP